MDLATDPFSSLRRNDLRYDSSRDSSSLAVDRKSRNFRQNFYCVVAPDFTEFVKWNVSVAVFEMLS